MSESVTAVILLGASNFPRHHYGPGLSFLRSKQDFRAYVQNDEHGFAVPDSRVLDLFDSHHPPSAQLVAIGKFLDKFSSETAKEELRNLIIYYVGHGYFCGLRQDYHVALSCLETNYESTTGLKITELAEVIKLRARSYRRFVILDCCFAAEALAQFQGQADDAISVKAINAFSESLPQRPKDVPTRGTALFCAADKDSVALSPKGQPHTMFTGAFLKILDKGDARGGEKLSLSEICELTWEHLRGHYEEPVRPVLHSPDQSEGDIAVSVTLFRNAFKHQNAQFARSKSVPDSEATSVRRSATDEKKHPEENIEVRPEVSLEPSRVVTSAGAPVAERQKALLLTVVLAFICCGSVGFVYVLSHPELTPNDFWGLFAVGLVVFGSSIFVTIFVKKTLRAIIYSFFLAYIILIVPAYIFTKFFHGNIERDLNGLEFIAVLCACGCTGLIVLIAIARRTGLGVHFWALLNRVDSW
ncbi:hypothetical protein [Paraburkholderia xenovorans]|uniref:hypothetical protein n=1 Tax=Paraburkholderia xenovorans TaxID=36873 RepID=UPI0038BA1CFB